MLFQQILLEIFYKLKNERTISSAYHILRGKRSGSTIQDIGIFQLHSYFNILPKLSREVYNQAINGIVKKHWLEIKEDQHYVLLEDGIHQLKNQSGLHFDGWHYRGREHLFFARLSLIVQSLSHHRLNVRSFRPIQKDEAIQRWVKQFLVSNKYQNRQLQARLFQEMTTSIEKLPIDERLKNVIILRLSGHQVTGLTWQQISAQFNQSEMDIQLLYIAGLHCWLNEIERNGVNYPLLAQVNEGIRVKNTLTASTTQTVQLFKKGYTIEQISDIRRLKRSTVEDHLVELAMNDETFPIMQFVSEEDIRKIWEAVEGYNTRKLKILHEVIPDLSYFQIRLVLARGEINES